MLTRTCPLVVLPLRTSPLVVLLYGPSSPTHVIHQLRTSPHATSLKCEHGIYKPTSLVSWHESNMIWTSPLISSCVHHHSWTYPLMTQHLLIQVRINAYKQHTQANNCSTIAWRSLSVAKQNACADRLVGHPHRQAPGLSQTHCYMSIAWRSSPCRQAPRGARTPCWSYRLVVVPVPPGAILVAHQLLFF